MSQYQLISVFLILLCMTTGTQAVWGGECRPLSGGSTFLLKTQSDLDALIADCTKLIGNVEFACEDTTAENSIKEFNVFKRVVEITGYLRIQQCSFIKSMEGFESLRSIQGQNTYTTPDASSGFSVYIADNPNLVHLGGFQNLQVIAGGGIKGRGRVAIKSNNNLCYTGKLHWTKLLGNDHGRVLDQVDGADGNCLQKSCIAGCKFCVGPDSIHCQVSSSSSSNKDTIIIVCLVLFIIFFVVFAIFFYLYLTNRCGCKFRLGQKELQVGVLSRFGNEKPDKVELLGVKRHSGESQRRAWGPVDAEPNSVSDDPFASVGLQAFYGSNQSIQSKRHTAQSLPPLLDREHEVV